MGSWRNASGRPLSSIAWLDAHHRAKLQERTKFAQKILALQPRKIVDLGCGPGIWLDLFDQLAPPDCELIGIDSDADALDYAAMRASGWRRPHQLLHADFDRADVVIPIDSVVLAFNVFPYLNNPAQLIADVCARLGGRGHFVIRQYDGNLLRFGPMDQHIRQSIDTALYASLSHSRQIRHYDLDRVFEIIHTSRFYNKSIEFDTFYRQSPYDKYFVEYLVNCLQWTGELVSEQSSLELKKWLDRYIGTSASPSYVVETELVAWLS